VIYMINPIFIILFNFLTGTLCLVYGVNLLSEGLEKANTEKLKKILTTCTGSLPKAFVSGAFLTALVQSSTTITVITVGLVNSGLITLSNAAGIIYGANIGTTLTAQLMSFKITEIGLPALVVGLLLGTFSKKRSLRNLGKIITGFGFIFTGLNTLNASVPYIKESRFVYNIFLKYGKSPVAGLFIGMLATMLVHSSSATVGFTIVLFNAGLIDFSTAIGLTLGDNIGTCFTAHTAGLGGNIWAHRTAWVHTLYNVICVIAVLIFFRPFADLAQNVTLMLGQDKSRLVANTHTIFNVLGAVIFLPINKYYINFINTIIIERNNKNKSKNKKKRG